MNFLPYKIKIGVLGAGQLGKMMAQAASRLDLELRFLDKSKNYPAGKISNHFTEGDFNDFQTVVDFGSDMDVLTIEIEHVNIEALEFLEKKGVKVYPQSSVLKIIQDKAIQKQFILGQGFPTAPFHMFNDTDSIFNMQRAGNLKFPFVQKSRTGGYDGKGVQIIRTVEDMGRLLEGSSIIEHMADIEKEISVIAVRNSKGECLSYPAVSMDFHPEANLVEFLTCPAEIPIKIEDAARMYAEALANAMNIVGLLAVEMFYNKDGRLWINEMAPRPHNSGHHSLDNGSTDQFENHIRAILDLPLGSTKPFAPAIMLNILGEEGFSGKALYTGLEQCLEIEGVHVHLYGKEETRPFRKMGHITIIGTDLAECKDKASIIKKHLKVIA
ncbi:MAG: 5-(carboxyamino)imidazole ribonucleotide synthase [Bacteroidota bacterium]|nr:5-(carboxyamino)imidazole ribonucleotide synthase [Bacteroidota bacterium]